jgi:hypothetical protein
MIDPGGRGLDQLQPRRTGQQLRVGNQQLAYWASRAAGDGAEAP